jgi:hypothetical protein
MSTYRHASSPSRRASSSGGRTLSLVALFTVVAISSLLLPVTDSSAASATPLAPTSVVAAQSGPGPDLAISWVPSSSGTPATGAVVQLYEAVADAYVDQTQITCGAGCTSAVFRGLSFGSSYEGLVWPTSADGTGASDGSTPTVLTTSCPVGACVSMDATTPIGPANQAAAGVLDAVFPVGNVAADMTALKAPMFRSAPAANGDGTFNWNSWKVAVGTGAQTTLVLSSEYSAAYGGSPPTPWSDWTAYNAEITLLVTRLVASGEPINYWEVYNEPGGDDGYYSAAGYATETPALLLQQFLATYQDILTVVPGANIIGPSLEHWSDYPGQYSAADHSFDMDTFLNFAATNDLKLAAISWHEIDDSLGANPEENTLYPTMIEDHVAEARRLIASLPALGNPMIFINEYGMPEVQAIPGWDVSYLAALTDAGVNSASRACWGTACANPDLDGLIGTDGVSTPPIYFERLVYASMTGIMITTTSTEDSVAALGSYNSTNGTLIGLIGRGVGCAQTADCASSWPFATEAPSADVSVTVKVPWNSGTAVIALSDIEGQNSNTTSKPNPVVSTSPISPTGGSDGTFAISIPSFADGDAYGLVVTHIAGVNIPPPPLSPVGGSCVAPARGAHGYLLSASDGGVFNFGNIPFCGSTGAITLNKPIVGAALTPNGGGYWEVASDGGIFSFGDAQFYGSTGAIHLNQPIVGMAATPDAKGYWLVARDGGIFAFGDAKFYGSTGALHLNQPIVGMATTLDGNGYWLVAKDGGVFAFGDAPFKGSMGGRPLTAPIVALSVDQSTGGYWEVASDGGIFAFDAPFFGSMGGHVLNQPIVAMASTLTGRGYDMVASDGGIFTFGDAPYDGSMGGTPLNRPIVAIASG